MTSRIDFGIRLKEERTRLRESQESFAAKAGVGKNAQIKYEQGSRSPDADYLQLVADIGVDVLYVLTGTKRPDLAVTAPELQLLARAVNSARAGGPLADDDMQRVEAAYSEQHRRAVAAGRAPSITLTERHIKLINAFDACTEAGRKTVERIAQLEGSRAKPRKASTTKVSVQAVDIRGDGNVVGANNNVHQSKP